LSGIYGQRLYDVYYRSHDARTQCSAQNRSVAYKGFPPTHDNSFFFRYPCLSSLLFLFSAHQFHNLLLKFLMLMSCLSFSCASLHVPRINLSFGSRSIPYRSTKDLEFTGILFRHPLIPNPGFVPKASRTPYVSICVLQPLAANPAFFFTDLYT